MASAAHITVQGLLDCAFIHTAFIITQQLKARHVTSAVSFGLIVLHTGQGCVLPSD